MFEDFFENNAPAEEENPAAERREQIRAAVMTRISRESEEKKMKHIHLRPLIIAAAVISVSTLSLATAYAAANNTAYDTIVKSGDVTIYHKADEGWHEIKGTPSDSGNPPGASAVTICYSDGEYWYEIKETPSDSGDSGNSPDAADVTIYHKADDDWHEIKDTPSDSEDSGNPPDTSAVTISYSDGEYRYEIKEIPSDSGDSSNPPDSSDVTIYHKADDEWIEEIHEDSSPKDNINSVKDIIVQMDQEDERDLYYRLDDEDIPDEIIISMKQEIQEIERDTYIRLDDIYIPDDTK